MMETFHTVLSKRQKLKTSTTAKFTSQTQQPLLAFLGRIKPGGIWLSEYQSVFFLINGIHCLFILPNIQFVERFGGVVVGRRHSTF